MLSNKARKRIIASSVALALSATLTLSLAGCSQTPTEPKELKSVSLAYTPGNSYVLGETVREPNNQLTLTYTDGSKEYLPTTDSSVTVTGDTSTTGKHTGKITYGDYEFSFTYTVYETLEDTVEVTGGEIRGYSTLDGSVEMYKGIPYAAPPVGNLRWHAPQDVEEWDGVLDCYHYGPSPVQNVRSNDAYLIDPWAGTSEDCLTLNVWTSGREMEESSSGKPVLVFIYGGGFTAGGGSVPIYDGTAMAEKDVVYVNFNYRLGEFGFLATEELKAENDGCGNFAILDQIKALEWVRDNIAQFGGDPDNVTIMGQSAGAMSVEALVASPLADGLFVNAAILSAGMYFTSDLATMDEAVAKANTNGNTIAQLRSMTTEEVSAAIKTYNGNVVYDNYVITSPSTKDAFATSAAPNSKNVNILVGTVTGDASLYGDMRDIESGTRNDLTVAQRNMLVNAHIQAGGTGKNWQYYYSYIQGGAKSAGHTDDVTFWLGNTCDKYSWSQDDSAMSELLSAYIVNFCKTGDPNGGELPAWQESTGDYGYLHIDTTIEYTHLSDSIISEFEAAYSDLAKYFPSHN